MSITKEQANHIAGIFELRGSVNEKKQRYVRRFCDGVKIKPGNKRTCIRCGTEQSARIKICQCGHKAGKITVNKTNNYLPMLRITAGDKNQKDFLDKQKVLIYLHQTVGGCISNCDGHGRIYFEISGKPCLDVLKAIRQYIKRPKRLKMVNKLILKYDRKYQ